MKNVVTQIQQHISNILLSCPFEVQCRPPTAVFGDKSLYTALVTPLKIA